MNAITMVHAATTRAWQPTATATVPFVERVISQLLPEQMLAANSYAEDKFPNLLIIASWRRRSPHS
jgi:hypothetical protein